MESPLNSKLYSSLEQLLDKMEKMQVKESIDNSNIERMITALDRLTEATTLIESQRREEVELAAKLDNLALSLEKTFAARGAEQYSGSGVEKTMRKIIRNTKLIGQILAIVATSVQLAVDSVGTVLHSENDDTQTISGTARAKTQADLAMLLQPLSALVQGLVEEKMKKDTNIDENTVQAADIVSQKGSTEEKNKGQNNQ